MGNVMLMSGAALLIAGGVLLWSSFAASVAADNCLPQLEGRRYRVLCERSQRRAMWAAISIVAGLLTLCALGVVAP